MLQPSARARIHLAVLALEDPRIGVEPAFIDVEEVERPAVRAGRVGGELVREQHEEPLARECREPALELLGIAAARGVRVVPPGMKCPG